MQCKIRLGSPQSTVNWSRNCIPCKVSLTQWPEPGFAGIVFVEKMGPCGGRFEPMVWGRAVVSLRTEGGFEELYFVKRPLCMLIYRPITVEFNDFDVCLHKLASRW